MRGETSTQDNRHEETAGMKPTRRFLSLGAGDDIALNQGCATSVELRVAKGTSKKRFCSFH